MFTHAKELRAPKVDHVIFLLLWLLAVTVVISGLAGLGWVAVGNLASDVGVLPWYFPVLYGLWSALGALPVVAFVVLIFLVIAFGTTLFDPDTPVPSQPPFLEATSVFLVVLAFAVVIGTAVSAFDVSGLGYHPFGSTSQEQYSEYRLVLETNSSSSASVLVAIGIVYMLGFLYFAVSVATQLRSLSWSGYFVAALIIATGLTAAFAFGTQMLLVQVSRTPSVVSAFGTPSYFQVEELTRLQSSRFAANIDRARIMDEAYETNTPLIPGPFRRADSFFRTAPDGARIPAGPVDFFELWAFYADEAFSTITLDAPEVFGQRFTELRHNPAYWLMATAVMLFRGLMVVVISPMIFWFLGRFLSNIEDTADTG